jgi:hypothetical protein
VDVREDDSLKATTTIIASTQQQAREQAESAFRDFYGAGVEYKIVAESAESYFVTMTGHIEGWRCEFEAEESQ